MARTNNELVSFAQVGIRAYWVAASRLLLLPKFLPSNFDGLDYPGMVLEGLQINFRVQGDQGEYLRG